VPRTTLLAVLALALTGCAANERNHDVKGFTQADDPAERAILGSIATYRTTTDESKGCDLVTQHFLDARFEGEKGNCEQVLRTADRFLPDTADVRSVEGDSATVLVDEPTATKSIYSMRREAGTWKIYDIKEAR
jgi:hypothetical protein